MFLGIKAKKTRTADAETRKTLIKGQFAKRHYVYGSAVLAVMVLGTFGGMAVTYLNNGKLFVGPHLLVGIALSSVLVDTNPNSRLTSVTSFTFSRIRWSVSTATGR